MSNPRLVGRYEFNGVIGKGGFGVVEEYRDILTNEHVAIKTIPARFVNQESKRLVREIDTMCFLHDAHPHVIGFFSMFVTPYVASDGRQGIEHDVHFPGPVFSGEFSQHLDVEGSEYVNLNSSARLIKHHSELELEVSKMSASDEFNLHIVMPLMKGDLLYFIKHASSSSNKLNMTNEFIDQVAIVFAFQICFGLDYLHKSNIVHRDMKPENILVRLHSTNPYESAALIADLGLARDAQPSDTFYVCTRYYRPPEIITNVSRGETSIDVWSLGCIFFEMVTGRPLFTVNSALNEHGVWEGQRASTQLEVILNIIGTPSHDEIKRFMPIGNPQQYLLRSVSRPSRLKDEIIKNWKLRTTLDKQKKWINVISRCLAFFPQQRPTCEELCRDELFKDCNILYGINVNQQPTKIYQPTRVGTLVSENKQIVLNLVKSAIRKTSPYIEESTTDEAEWVENNFLASPPPPPFIPYHNYSGEEELQNEENSLRFFNDLNTMGTQISSSFKDGTTSFVLEDSRLEYQPQQQHEEEKKEEEIKNFPIISDSELYNQYVNWKKNGEQLSGVVSRLLEDLQYHTHNPERSEQLRLLLKYFISLR